MKAVLVASKEQDAIQSITHCFAKGYRVDSASSKTEALQCLKIASYEYLYIDQEILLENQSGSHYKAALKPIWELNPAIEIIVMTPPTEMRNAVMIVKAGARNYLTYPIEEAEVRLVSKNIRDSIVMASELDYLRDKFWRVDSLDVVRTNNPRMQKVFDQIRSVAPTKSTVLLMGETGTGKTLMAKLIHQHSNRGDDPFISVHCGAIPETLLESELYGHEKGAFTGSVRQKLGRFEIAGGGTIFLDEIGTITAAAQVKLLQILQDGTFQRVGGEEILKANVRVIAATNSDLLKMCDTGEFRKDLYYRLNVFPIQIPPLKERLQDLSQICNSILDKLNKFESKEIHDIDDRVIEAFQRYTWPGNIRELENLIERAYILETSSILTVDSFPSELFEHDSGIKTSIDTAFHSLAQTRRQGIETIERNYLRELLKRCHGKINDSARKAGISPRQLNKLMNRYKISKEEFKKRQTSSPMQYDHNHSEKNPEDRIS
jgi:DNA-binding NtrC family response regulator